MTDILRNAAPLARGATLSDQVTEALRRSVTSGAFAVGSPFPSESALSQELSVSRSVVREAVARLKAEGLLHSQQGRGAYVASTRPRMGFAIDMSDVANLQKLSQVLELRLGVEIEAAAIAATRRTPEDLAELDAAVERFSAQQRHSPENARDGVEADMRFHRALCEATGNAYYLSLFNYLSASLQESIEAGRLRALERGGDSREAAEEHRAIAEAIRAQDASAARRLMRRHLVLSRDRLLGNLSPGAARPKAAE
ncbi:FadR/GntR family transcriptional regulator [Salipiger marinus]|uniref:FadR/GntR family transcriptional regulator n=1 Tax=Salipiger marinus TaxID=555512 RepID=UPI0040588FAA